MHHPYGLRLRERLQHKLASTSIEIDIDALAGDRVVAGQYIPRLELRRTKEALRYDWIIIQGGGNDLIHGTKPEAIYEALKRVWRITLDSGANVLALTVTETADRIESVRAKYNALNKMVVNHKERGFYVADVAGAVTWPELSEDQRKIWDDGLHFTRLGYDMLGDAIADKLLLALSPPLTANM